MYAKMCARKVFERSGNPEKLIMTEPELQAIIEAAVNVAVEAIARRERIREDQALARGAREF